MAASIAPDLDDAIARQLRHGSGGRRSGDEQPLPVDLRAADAARALRAVLADVTGRLVAEDGNLPRRAMSIAAMARWTERQVPRIAIRQDAAGIREDVQRAVTRAAMVLDGPPPRQYAGPCPICGYDVLGKPGSAIARCTQCGHAVEVRAQQDAMRAAMDDMLFTAAELVSMARALGQLVSEFTVRSWVHRGQLVAKGTRPRGNGQPMATYRFGDVLILIARSQRVRG
jgi:hypothetical protein